MTASTSSVISFLVTVAFLSFGTAPASLPTALCPRSTAPSSRALFVSAVASCSAFLFRSLSSRARLLASLAASFSLRLASCFSALVGLRLRLALSYIRSSVPNFLLNMPRRLRAAMFTTLSGMVL